MCGLIAGPLVKGAVKHLLCQNSLPIRREGLPRRRDGRRNGSYGPLNCWELIQDCRTTAEWQSGLGSARCRCWVAQAPLTRAIWASRREMWTTFRSCSLNGEQFGLRAMRRALAGGQCDLHGREMSVSTKNVEIRASGCGIIGIITDLRRRGGRRNGIEEL